MTSPFRSDLFRNLMSGFALGAVALIAMTPAEGTDTLKTAITSIYKA